MSAAKTILVVDDSRVSRMLTRAFILSKRPDWVVEEACSGEEVLGRVQALSPALILIDVNMPGMGGLAAAEKLRHAWPAARISLLTANVQDATRNKASALGIGFAAKPITEARIHQIIDDLGDR